MKNHSDPRCEQYNLAKVLPKDSDMNTMSCEQTFAWLSWLHDSHGYAMGVFSRDYGMCNAKNAPSLLPPSDGATQKQLHFMVLFGRQAASAAKGPSCKLMHIVCLY